MICKTCKLLIEGRCTYLDLPVGNLDPACAIYVGPNYKGRNMQFTDDDDDDEYDDEDYDDDEDYYDDDEDEWDDDLWDDTEEDE
jgi:hypothetical protein